MRAPCFILVLSLLIEATVAPAQSPVSPASLPQAPVPVPGSPPVVTAVAGQAGAAALPGSTPPSPGPELLPLPAPLAPPPGVHDVPVPAVPIPPPAPPGDYLVLPGVQGVLPYCDDGPRFWLQADFLLWFIKDGPLNVPLVTTGSTADANPGALGQPHTQVLFGNSSLDYGTIPGGRLELGYWFGAESRFGIEGGFFLLSQENIGFSVFSNNAGSPVLSVPILNAQTGKEDQVPASIPGVYAGGVIVTSSSMLGGANIDGSFNLVRRDGFQADLLAGFRFVDLRERLEVQTPDFTIGSAASASGSTTYNTVDSFRTSNQFYGGQLGSRLAYRGDRLSVELDGLVSLGSTNQSINIDGYGVSIGPSGGPPSFSAGGIFAQPSNMGHYWCWDFTVVPEAELKIGYRVWRNLRVTAGYDFLYWSSVVRPGAQINRDVNLSQSGLLGGGTLTGPAQPVAPLTRSDFFVHGVSIGLDWRW